MQLFILLTWEASFFGRFSGLSHAFLGVSLPAQFLDLLGLLSVSSPKYPNKKERLEEN